MSQRVRGIDAARGAAMFFVCLSHFSAVYFGETQSAAKWLPTIAMVAQPTFMLISGMMLGLLYRRDVAGFPRMQARFFDRALFLLTGGHLLIMSAQFLHALDPHVLLRMNFITDAIAVSMLIGGPLITRTSASTRAAGGAFLFLASWVVVLTWEPHVPGSTVLKDTLVGAYGRPSTWVYSVPLLPWLGVYLMGTALGDRMAVLGMRRQEDRFIKEIFVYGAAALVLAITLKTTYLVARDLGWLTSPDLYLAARSTAALSRKVPPSPEYLLLFGGSGLLIVGTVLSLERRGGALAPVMQWSALLGRNSLFVFILQFYVYIVALEYLGLTVNESWPLVFAGSLALITMSARQWDRYGRNRYLSLRWLWPERAVPVFHPGLNPER